MKQISSRFRGVTWRAGLRKWAAQIRFDLVNCHLGLFADEEAAAARAYDRAALDFFGMRAKLDFPLEVYQR